MSTDELNQVFSKEESAPPKNGIGCFAYVVAGMSFFPLIGVPLGIVVLIYGLFKWKQKGWILSLIGLCGCGFTFLVYGTLFYAMLNPDFGPWADSMHEAQQRNIINAIKRVESWKSIHGRYPESIQEIIKSEENMVKVIPKDKNLMPYSATENAVYFYDIISERVQFSNRIFSEKNDEGYKPSFLQYRLDKDCNQYYLFSVGLDRIPFTTDDVLPEIDLSASDRLGYSHRHLDFTEQVKCRVKSEKDTSSSKD